MHKKQKLLSPKIDVIFQGLFGEVGNERITKKFLEEILGEKIDRIDLRRNPILRREKIDDKLGILDVVGEYNNGEIFNIEMQRVEQGELDKRFLFYWARTFCRELKGGNDYSKLKRTVMILIADYEMEILKEEGYHTTWKIIKDKDTEKGNNEKGRVLTNLLEIHIINLKKIRGKEKEEDGLLDWLYFIDNPKSERAERAMREKVEIREANEKLNQMIIEARLEKIAEWKEKAILDATSAKSYAERKGREKKAVEIAKKMIKKKIDIKSIAELTGLTEEEIRKLE